MKESEKEETKLNVPLIMAAIFIVLSWILIGYLATTIGFFDWSAKEYNKITSNVAQTFIIKAK